MDFLTDLGYSSRIGKQSLSRKFDRYFFHSWSRPTLQTLQIYDHQLFIELSYDFSIDEVRLVTGPN